MVPLSDMKWFMRWTDLGSFGAASTEETSRGFEAVNYHDASLSVPLSDETLSESSYSSS